MERKDVWAAGDRYEPYVGRWSRLVARELLAWLEVPPRKDWLDVGCGTGALTEVILQQAEPRTVTGVDSSKGFLEYARARIGDPRVTFKVGDAQMLPIDGAAVDAAVSGLVLNFVPQPARAAAEMARAVRPEGIIAAYVWDYGEKMQMIRYFWDAAVVLDPEAPKQDEARFPLCRPEALAGLFTSAGLREVEVRPIDVTTRFRDFQDYWFPFLGGQGPAPSYVAALSEERRTALRERIRARLPVAKDGSIQLVARAWAVRGRPAPAQR
ncbi:MAG TPA: methyltransferase domain-containing protein [bacterium]|nr:methyltransferase domain-containing protein [bacterium]